VISVCFSWALGPNSSHYRFLFGCWNCVFVKHNGYGRESYLDDLVYLVSNSLVVLQHMVMCILSYNPKRLIKLFWSNHFQMHLFGNTEINNQPVNLNYGDNNNSCCPPTHSWLPSCIAVWINYDLNCLCNLLFLLEYSARHHCWDALTESWRLCVPKRQIFFFTTFKKSFILYLKF